MSLTSKPALGLQYHPEAYRFVFDALHFAQEQLQRPASLVEDNEDAHISGQELLEGVRQLALQRYGNLVQAVFTYWGVRRTEDFGRIVFELIERGEMRKTDQDQLDDFVDVYDFQQVFDRDYAIDTSKAFCSL